MSDDERISKTADYILNALATPIRGEPSVMVVNRENAKRLLVGALKTVWEAKTEARDEC
jgi:hypothetical protein